VAKSPLFFKIFLIFNFNKYIIYAKIFGQMATSYFLAKFVAQTKGEFSWAGFLA
jgi:hypothetical protein